MSNKENITLQDLKDEKLVKELENRGYKIHKKNDVEKTKEQEKEKFNKIIKKYKNKKDPINLFDVKRVDDMMTLIECAALIGLVEKQYDTEDGYYGDDPYIITHSYTNPITKKGIIIPNSYKTIYIRIFKPTFKEETIIKRLKELNNYNLDLYLKNLQEFFNEIYDILYVLKHNDEILQQHYNKIKQFQEDCNNFICYEIK